MLIVLAIILASLSALTGIFAVGTGRHWKFRIEDYFLGKRNAILYLWVVTSTTFSICHAGVLAEYGFLNNWLLAIPHDAVWMVIHSCVGLLLSLAHIFVSTTLAKELTHNSNSANVVDTYLWGNDRVVH